MTRRKIPSFTALQIFEACARSESFTRAADEMALTQSAVCRQVANLEEFLGFALFARVKKRVVLTEAGREYAARISIHLEKIERDTLELMGNHGGGALELAVIPTFATQWLIPRLAGFKREHPEIQVNLSSNTGAFLFADSRFHAAIHSGKAPWPGAQGDWLLEEDAAVPLCSPALLRECLGKTQGIVVEDMMRLPLLHLQSRAEDWRHWFELHGSPHDVEAMAGAKHELFSMLIEAASAGLGAALAPKYMAHRQLALGSLLQIMPHSLPGQTGYWLAYPPERASHPAFSAFRAWLLTQAKMHQAAMQTPPAAAQN
ncbi:LysR substrate-binding domain-containing protein [Massilia sp. W12]|uniref:LysR substrate-binding domain-containing protein n=1 Tax=Massilia sp. W12 TaxID=3126507 RepID=UPI0030CB2139